MAERNDSGQDNGRIGQKDIAKDDHDRLLKEISDSLFFVLKKSPRPELMERCFAKAGVKEGHEFAQVIEDKLRGIFKLKPRVPQVGAMATGLVAKTSGFGKPVEEEEATQWDSDPENSGEGETSEFAATTEDDFEESDKETDWDGDEETPSTSLQAQLGKAWIEPPPYLVPPQQPQPPSSPVIARRPPSETKEDDEFHSTPACSPVKMPRLDRAQVPPTLSASRESISQYTSTPSTTPTPARRILGEIKVPDFDSDSGSDEDEDGFPSTTVLRNSRSMSPVVLMPPDSIPTRLGSQSDLFVAGDENVSSTPPPAPFMGNRPIGEAVPPPPPPPPFISPEDDPDFDSDSD